MKITLVNNFGDGYVSIHDIPDGTTVSKFLITVVNPLLVSDEWLSEGYTFRLRGTCPDRRTVLQDGDRIIIISKKIFGDGIPKKIGDSVTVTFINNSTGDKEQKSSSKGETLLAFLHRNGFYQELLDGHWRVNGKCIFEVITLDDYDKISYTARKGKGKT